MSLPKANALVVAEVEGARVQRATLSAISCARQAVAQRGGTVSVVVLGHQVRGAAEELAQYASGAVYVSDDPAYAPYLGEHHAPTVASVGRKYALIVGPATSQGKDLLPRVAARLDGAYAGDCTGVEDSPEGWVYCRPLFAGNALGYLTLQGATPVLSVRQCAFPAASPILPRTAAAPPPVIEVAKLPAGKAAERVEVVSLERIAQDGAALVGARIVVAGGRGLKDRFFELLQPLAHVLGAALGATRGACDAGVPSALQVGQTGQIIAPDLYIAVGISGAIQHLAGIRGARIIVAINRSPDAPIHRMADFSLVADATEAVPKLVEILSHRPAKKLGSL